MKVRLTVKHKKANVKTVVLHSDALIGRSTECNLRLASGQISRKHCKLLINDERVAIEDLGSSNGTYLNEQKLESKSITTLSTGDVLSIGAVSFVIAYDDPSDETQIRKKTSENDGPLKASPVQSAEDVDMTPAAGTPVFAKSAEEPSEQTASEDSDIDVDELTDEELEALLAEEDFEDDEEHISIELETDDFAPDAQIDDAEETVRISPVDNPVIQEEFASPPEDEEEEDDDDDDDDEEDVMNFLQDLQ